MSLSKRIACAVLRPAASVWTRVAPFVTRAWAHARLASMIQARLDPSVVIQGVPEVHGTGRMEFGKDLFLYRDLYLETQDEGTISVGDGVVMSRGVHLVAFTRITIGDGAMIGEYSSIRDANHRFGGGRPVRHSGHDSRPITIGRNVWIGRSVSVLPGVTIGDGAVIGANAVVTRDVAPGQVVVGIPAKPVVAARDK